MTASSEPVAGDGADNGADRRAGDLARARRSAHGPPINRLFSTFVGLVVIGLIPWEIYLGHSLPPRFDVHDWGVLWIGFDAVLIVVLAYTAWAFWFRRQILVSTAIVAGTLLMCDAWFDVVTSIGSPGAWVSLVTAVFGEIPLALFFFWVAYRLLARTVAAFHAAMGRPGPPPKIRDAVVLFAPTDPPRRESPGQAPAPGAGAAR